MTPPEPIEGVIFDFHSTLVDGGDADRWVADGWERLGRAGTPADGLGEDAAARLTAFLHRIWEHARVVDPGSERDRDAGRHRQVWDETLARQGDADRELSDALYAVMLQQWVPYDDTLPVLRALRGAGRRVVVLSNVGVDIRPLLETTGIAALVDGVVLSCDQGDVKPEPAIFEQALRALGVPAERALMVGDAWADDGGAAALGIRTLLLPRTEGPVHGLSAVLRLVGTA